MACSKIKSHLGNELEVHDEYDGPIGLRFHDDEGRWKNISLSPYDARELAKLLDAFATIKHR